jgi:hypothetical protein
MACFEYELKGSTHKSERKRPACKAPLLSMKSDV